MTSNTMGLADHNLLKFGSFLNVTGVKYDSRAIRFFRSPIHGYGVEALCDLNVGQNVATIPKASILSVETSALWSEINNDANVIRNTPASGTCKVDVDTVGDSEHPRDSLCPPLFQLPAALLFECVLAEKSRWKDYISILPQSLSQIGVPLSLSDEDVTKVFYGTSIDELTVRMRSALKDVFKNNVHKLLLRRATELNIELSAVERLTDADFIWAFACVTSRAFQVDNFHGNSMVPIADIFNHRTNGEHVHIEGESDESDSDSDDDSENSLEHSHNDGPSEPRDGGNEVLVPSVIEQAVNGNSKTQGTCKRRRTADENDELLIICVKAALKGEELFNTFGQKSNTSLYLNYGFTEKDNPYDSAYIHKRDVEDVMQAWSDRQKNDTTRSMTNERKRIIEEAGVVIYDDVLDDYFEIFEDGSLRHGLIALLYLYVARWDELERFSDDSMDMLQHLMEVSMDDLLSRNRNDVCDIVRQLVERQLSKLSKYRSREDDIETLRHKHTCDRLHAARIRGGQRAALDAAYRVHVRDVGTAGNGSDVRCPKRVKV